MRLIIYIFNFFIKSSKRSSKGIFSFLAVGIDCISYTIFVKILGFSVVISNIFSWGISESFSFFTNKLFKYKNKSDTLVFYEYIKFFFSRFFVLLFEIIVLKIMVDIVGGNEILVKFIIMVVILFVNFLINKFIVFSNSNYVSLKDWIIMIKNKFKKEN